MNLEMRFRASDDVRALWLLAIGVLLCGSVCVQLRFQTAIRAAHDRTELLYRQTVADTRIIGQASSLHRIQAQAERDLARVSREPSLSAVTANLLDTLHGSATAFHTTVLELQPAQAQAAAQELQAVPITIRVRGRFRNILQFVEDLSHHATLVRVSDTEMAVSNDAGPSEAEPRLDATIHATLYRLTMPPKEVRVATAG